jgi:hypothetical protein
LSQVLFQALLLTGTLLPVLSIANSHTAQTTHIITTLNVVPQITFKEQNYGTGSIWDIKTIWLGAI